MLSKSLERPVVDNSFIVTKLDTYVVKDILKIIPAMMVTISRLGPSGSSKK